MLDTKLDLKKDQIALSFIDNLAGYAVITLDQSGTILDWNKGASDLFGFQKKEMIGKSLSKTSSLEDSKKELHSRIQKAATTGNVTHEWYRGKKDGSVFWAKSIMTKVFDEDDTCYLVEMVVDLSERKRSEEMLELAGEIAKVGGWEFNLVNNTLTWNKETKRIHEVEPDFVPDIVEGINFYKQGESRETIKQVVAQAIDDGTPYDEVLQLVTAKGNLVWVRAKGQAEHRNGTCIRIYGSFQEIYEQQRKEAELAKKSAALEEAQRLAKIGSWEWDTKTGQIQWSDEMYRILDIPENERVDHVNDFYPYVHPEDLEHVQSATAAAVETQIAIPLSYRILTKKGEVKYVNASGTQKFGEDGNPTKMIGTVQDVTEQTQLKNRLDTFWEYSQEMMCFAGMDGYFKKLNPMWQEVLGYSSEELCSKPFIEFVHPDDREATLREAAKLGEGAITVNFINRYQTRSGVYKWLRWSAGSDPYEQMLYATARDITQEIDDAWELKQYAKELEEKNKELEQFTYIASHDLQEPLRTLISMIEIFESQYVDHNSPEAMKVMDYITSSSQRMQGLIKGLLDYSRLGTKSERVKVNCQEIVQDVLDDLAKSINDSRAKIHVGELPIIKGHETELRLLFQNLIGNALKFTREGVVPVVKVHAEKKKDAWKFSVEDNGIGIEEKYYQRIFMIFQRTNSRAKFEGTGIGLAHAKKIVSLHGGEIWVNSNFGAGSEFSFKIPQQ
ncbi:MAG: PAS domain-containing protein [Flavobacteriales bacterium]|nr:PAS domain-containing protein [Flavobacteriales bacterium]